MKHVVLILFSLIGCAAGLYILVATKASTTPGIVAGTGLVAFGILCALPARGKEAAETLGALWKARQ